MRARVDVLSLVSITSTSSTNLSSFSHHRRHHHPLRGSTQAPTWLEPPHRPPLHRLRWIRRCRGLPGRIPVAATFSARSAVPLAGSRLPDWIRCCRGLPGRICRFPSILPRVLWGTDMPRVH
jgi:hypothetical protein